MGWTVRTVHVDVCEVRDRTVVCQTCGGRYTQFARTVCTGESEYTSGVLSKLLHAAELAKKEATDAVLKAAREQLALAALFPHRCTCCGHYAVSDLQQIRDGYEAYRELAKKNRLWLKRDRESYQAELDRANAPEVVKLWLAHWEAVGLARLDRVWCDDETWQRCEPAERSLTDEPKHYASLLKALHKFDPWWPGHHGVSLQGDVTCNYRRWWWMDQCGPVFLGALLLAILVTIGVTLELSPNVRWWRFVGVLLVVWLGLAAPTVGILYHLDPYRRIIRAAQIEDAPTKG
jgi:hypothetical protein